MLELLAALDDCSEALEGGADAAEAAMSLCLLHLVAALRAALREEVAPRALSSALRLRALLRSASTSVTADADAALLALHTAVRALTDAAARFSRLLHEALQRPLERFLPETAFASAPDVASLLPPPAPSPRPPPAAVRHRRLRPALSTVALLEAAVARLECIAAYLDGRLLEAPSGLRLHEAQLAEEAASLAAFTEAAMPHTCAHQMDVTAEDPDDADLAARWCALAWSAASSTALSLSALLTGLTAAARVRWFCALLTPCVHCAPPWKALWEMPESPSAPPLPQAAAAVLEQPALYEAPAFSSGALQALAALLTALVEEAHADSPEAVHAKGDRGRESGNGGTGHRLTGRKRKSLSFPSHSEGPARADSALPADRSDRVLESLLLLVRVWSGLPEGSWSVCSAEVSSQTCIQQAPRVSVCET